MTLLRKLTFGSLVALPLIFAVGAAQTTQAAEPQVSVQYGYNQPYWGGYYNQPYYYNYGYNYYYPYYNYGYGGYYYPDYYGGYYPRYYYRGGRYGGGFVGIGPIRVRWR